MPGKYSFGLLVMLCGLCLCNGQIITITATVADSASGQPLEAAYAELYQYNTKINAASSDSLGIVKFKIPAGQNYSMHINYIGYTGAEIPITFYSDTTIQIMLHNYLVELSPVEVRKKMLNGPPYIISDPDLTNGGYCKLSCSYTILYQSTIFTGDLISIINDRIPGTYSMHDGANGEIQFYGSRADATKIIIDGIPVVGDYHIPANTISSINVYDMSIPAKYGDVTGGVIEITTKNGLDFW